MKRGFNLMKKNKWPKDSDFEWVNEEQSEMKRDEREKRASFHSVRFITFSRSLLTSFTWVLSNLLLFPFCSFRLQWKERREWKREAKGTEREQEREVGSSLFFFN